MLVDGKTQYSKDDESLNSYIYEISNNMPI